MIYYFWAYVQLINRGKDVSNLVYAIPCSNLGNLTSGILAQQMGLPVKRFVSVEKGDSESG